MHRIIVSVKERTLAMCKTEIGSEFWTGCTPKSHYEYTMQPSAIYDTHWFNIVETLSGRTALEHIVEILRRQGKKTAILPSYCCHTMIEPFLTHGIDVSFYDVQLSSKGIHRLIDTKGDYDALLLLDYFGHIDVETIELAQKAKCDRKTVIYDATHSLYSPIITEPYDFIYGSYRKWIDVNCGFVAWKKERSYGEISQNENNKRYALIREEIFDKKESYIKRGNVKKEEFLDLIEIAETILETEYHHKIPDKRSMEVLKTADASYIQTRRMENARVLTEAINELDAPIVRCLNSHLNTLDVPLFVPVLVQPEKRNSLRGYLIKNKIYCPVHWPLSSIHDEMSGSKQLFESELSLICDQRYGVDDMKRIARAIDDYLKKN